MISLDELTMCHDQTFVAEVDGAGDVLFDQDDGDAKLFSCCLHPDGVYFVQAGNGATTKVVLKR